MADVHDRFRVYASGNGSGALVERNIRRAIERFPTLMVNAVYRPDTVERIPDSKATMVIRYFDVLSLTHFWGRSQKGNSVMQRTTSRSWFGRVLQRVAEWCRRRDPSALHAIEQIR